MLPLCANTKKDTEKTKGAKYVIKIFTYFLFRKKRS